MRQIGLTDLYHAARVVQTAPEAARNDTCAELFWQAHVADKYVKRLRKLHPVWGDGSLRAAALAQSNRPGSTVVTPDLHRCLMIVLCAVLRGQGPAGASCLCERVCTLPNCAK